MRALLTFVVLVFALSPARARADWEYTKWGMTPEQVASASKGAVTVIPPGKREKGGIVESGAKGSYAMGAVKMDAGFLFEAKTGLLVCVVYTVINMAQNEMLETEMVKRFGPPAKSSNLGGMGKDVKWVSPSDDIELVGARGGPLQVTHCKPGTTFY